MYLMYLMRWKNVFCNGLTLLEMRGSGKVQRHTISVYIGGTIRNNSKKGKKGKREKGKKGVSSIKGVFKVPLFN
jgi:hypothetical protein